MGKNDCSNSVWVVPKQIRTANVNVAIKNILDNVQVTGDPQLVGPIKIIDIKLFSSLQEGEEVIVNLLVGDGAIVDEFKQWTLTSTTEFIDDPTKHILTAAATNLIFTATGVNTGEVGGASLFAVVYYEF